MDKETIENNRLIAEFMGLAYCEKYRYKGWYQNSEFNHRICDYNGLKYHSSWDWLMPVVQVCKDNQLFGSQHLIDKIDDVLTCDCKINNLYMEVVHFIEWFNENRK